MPLTHGVPCLVAEQGFLSGTVKIMQATKPIHSVQFLRAGRKVGKPCEDIPGDPGEEGAGFLDVFLMHRDGDVPFLHDAGSAGDLGYQHLIVVLAVSVQIVPTQGDEDGALEVLPVDPLVVDGDLGGSPGVQGVEQFRVVQKHLGFIALAGYGIIDIREPNAL